MIPTFDDQIPKETDPETGLPIGPVVAESGPALRPERVVLEGRYCRLEPLDAVRHRVQLFEASSPPDAAARYRYLPDPIVKSQGDMDKWLDFAVASEDPLFFAVIDKRAGRVEGRQAFMNISPAHRSIEIGNIYWGPKIAGSKVSTEANFLFAQYAFDTLKYRRYEWKCNALNEPSRRAALRFGFTFEGHFRRNVIVKGRTRDTTWFSIIDEEWPAIAEGYRQWLDPANFDENGKQRARLNDLIANARASSA